MLNLELVTPEKISLKETVYEVILPTVDGQIAVLPKHIPLITLLSPGVISVRRLRDDSDDKLEHYATGSGFVEITGNSVKIMSDSAEHADELDEKKIIEARDEAKRQVKEAKDDVAYTDAVARLESELARIKVKNLKHRRG